MHRSEEFLPLSFLFWRNNSSQSTTVQIEEVGGLQRAGDKPVNLGSTVASVIRYRGRCNILNKTEAKYPKHFEKVKKKNQKMYYLHTGW